MQTKQADARKGEATTKGSLPQAEGTEYGLTFRGRIISVDEVKPWRDYATNKDLGLQCAVGLTDKRRIYTHSVKVPTGEVMPEFQYDDEILVVNAGCVSDKGQHRITGDIRKL